MNAKIEKNNMLIETLGNLDCVELNEEETLELEKQGNC